MSACPFCGGPRKENPCGKHGCAEWHRKKCSDCRKERARIEAEAQVALMRADIEVHA